MKQLNDSTMKKILLFSLLFGSVISFSQVGIGTTTPVASAQLDVTSTTKGFLPPRMTYDQKTAISSPAAGLIIWCIDCGTTGQLQIFNGTIWTNMIGGTAAVFVCGTTGVTFNYYGSIVTYGTVSSGGSKCWLDRNLGATQVATSTSDAASYGDLYQWGRGTDGHQIKTSTITTSLSGSEFPGNGMFIKAPIAPSDWQSTQKINLWQGANGINNPCPYGYRVPTDLELNTERSTWSSSNASGAFSSPLKLPMAGYRAAESGSLSGQTSGFYWSNTINGVNSRSLSFDVFNAGLYNYTRATGASIRCIKE